MSKCMTIDETIDQKDTFSEVTPKDIVDSVLEEILVSVLTVSDKGCNRIGDFSISEDFCQQYNQPLHVKDFEQASINQTSSAGSIYSGKNKDRSGNGNENSDADWFGKIEEKVKPAGECKVISEEILADNELQIQNGQIHLERIKSSLESAREEYFQKENVIKDDKIEIEYYNQGKLNKIYVPLNEQSKESNPQLQSQTECEDENKKKSEKENSEKKSESPFKPFTTEDLRQSILQVWANENSSLVGKWDGDMAGQPEEIVKLMEGLSNSRVYSEGSADPNRPRTCSVAEEDIKKMIKEIEEINFIQSHDTVEDYPPEGQGDADLESKSFTKSRDVLNKPRTDSRVLPKYSNEGMKKSQEEEVRSTEIRQDPDSESIPYIVQEPSTISLIQNLRFSQTNEIRGCSQEGRFEENIPSEERMELKRQGETIADEGLPTHAPDIQDKSSVCIEEIKENTEFSSDSVDLGSHDRIFSEKAEIINSSSISGNDVFSEFKVPSDPGVTQTLPVQCLIETTKEEQNTCSWSTQVAELPSDGKIKRFSEEENAAEENTVEENGKHPSENRLTETLPQGGNSDSQSHKSSSQSLTQSKELGILQSEKSLSSENQWEEVDSEKCESGKFKLHSIKMCLKMGCDPAGLQKNKSFRSESEEAFVESTESVLQIIEPEENCQNEESESAAVSFSLLPQETNEISQKSSVSREVKSQPEENLNDENLPSDEISEKKVNSGMTTIGPVKNTDYDPKDLRAPEIDFGKMTRITSSRQLAKDFNLLGADFTSTTTVKILEDDSDESITESDSDILETGSPVNRDIASLTKVQKIREVMSYQPKPEEDFEDEETLPKARLDLKDVESSTDERFKVPEVGIPLLSFDVTSEAIGTEAEAEKQLIESMGLIISGLTEPYYENLEENNERIENKPALTETAKESVENAEAKKETESISGLGKESSEKNIADVSSEVIGETESKYKTLSGVIRKASKKFMKKDSDVLLRNSKSLPRDTSRIGADRIRSILNESSTSASNVLKKSRSMLRSTQSLFKSISQNRMIDDVEKHKTSPSETDLNTVEKKLPFLLERKKEDFVKAKNLFKTTMEKTFKKQENPPEIAVEQPEVSAEKKDLQVVVRNEEKLRVDRMENFKRWLPKSTLVYKSQFVKSQIKIKDKTPETDADSKKEDENAQSELTDAVDEEAVVAQETVNETEAIFHREQNEDACEKFITEENLDLARAETQPSYIVMETIQGLPTSDLESPSSEKENVETSITSLENEKENEHQVSIIQPQAGKEKELDIIAELTETEDRPASKIPSERKMMAKKKKLSTRLRNFWCSAFGRVKTPPKKSDIS